MLHVYECNVTNGNISSRTGPISLTSARYITVFDIYIRKEAVLSSMIERTRFSLSDLLLFELDQEPEVSLNSAREVC